jgi:cytochrome P450
MMRKLDSYRAIESVLHSNDFQPALHIRDSRPLLDGCVLTLTGQEHRERRRLERPLFERRALEFYEHQTFKGSLQIAFEQAEAQRDEAGRPQVDLLWLTRMTLVPVTAAVVGLDGVDNETAVIHLEDISRRLGEGASVEWSNRNHQEVMEEAMEAKDDLLVNFYNSSLERRRDLVASWKSGDIEERELPTDLLTLALREYFDDFDEDLWLRESLFFVVASANTTTHATPHVFNEIIKWRDEHPEESYLLEQEVFVRHAVDEALRLHGPVPALLRRALKNTDAVAGHSFLADDDIGCMLGPANTDQEIYGARSTTFDPHRSEVLGRREAHGLSFGSGAHICSGRPLAIGLPSPRDGGPEVIGVLPRLISELLSRGAQLDPANLPTSRNDTKAERYASYPLIFETWPK